MLSYHEKAGGASPDWVSTWCCSGPVWISHTEFVRTYVLVFMWVCFAFKACNVNIIYINFKTIYIIARLDFCWQLVPQPRYTGEEWIYVAIYRWKLTTICQSITTSSSARRIMFQMRKGYIDVFKTCILEGSQFNFRSSVFKSIPVSKKRGF